MLYYSDDSGPDPGQKAVQQWLDSPGHYMNAMNPVYDTAGFGYFECPPTGVTHWTTLYKKLN